MVTEDRLLTIDEAAVVLKTTKDYLYRHWKEFPFTVRLSPRQLRFSAKGIERYIEEMQHAGKRVSAAQ
jgi:predicted DNA-binding transcriptional regulator AlpA